MKGKNLKVTSELRKMKTSNAVNNPRERRKMQIKKGECYVKVKMKI